MKLFGFKVIANQELQRIYFLLKNVYLTETVTSPLTVGSADQNVCGHQEEGYKMALMSTSSPVGDTFNTFPRLYQSTSEGRRLPFWQQEAGVIEPSDVLTQSNESQ